MKEVRAKIMGSVQGVFFRDFVKRTASSLGLFGYVQNNWDGSVELLAQGEEEGLKEFLEFLKEGPRMAKVEDMDIKWYDKIEYEYDRFSIAG